MWNWASIAHLSEPEEKQTFFCHQFLKDASHNDRNDFLSGGGGKWGSVGSYACKLIVYDGPDSCLGVGGNRRFVFESRASPTPNYNG